MDVWATSIDGEGHFLLADDNISIKAQAKRMVPDCTEIRTSRCEDTAQAVRQLRYWGAIE